MSSASNGATFDSKQAADQHGLELCKALVDEAIKKTMPRRVVSQKPTNPEGRKQILDLSQQQVRMTR
jgi:hypothetical protein